MSALLYLYLTTAAQGTLERFDLRPFPAIVLRDASNMKRGEIARAVLFESGREEIWVSRSALDNPSLSDAMDHEGSHLRAWREHGPGIDEHGPEWRRICRASAANPAKACRSIW